MQRMAKALAVTLVVSLALSGCSSLTAEKRRQAAVRHQLAKAQKARARSVAKTIKEKNRPLREPMTISEPATAVTLMPLESENVAAPVVVETATPQQPTP